MLAAKVPPYTYLLLYPGPDTMRAVFNSGTVPVARQAASKQQPNDNAPTKDDVQATNAGAAAAAAPVATLSFSMPEPENCTTGKSKKIKRTIPPEAPGTRAPFKALKLDQLPALSREFTLRYWKDDSRNANVEHVMHLGPKVPLDLNLVQHKRMYNYKKPYAQKIFARCPVCEANGCAEAWRGNTTPIIQHVASRGLDLHKWLKARVDADAMDPGWDDSLVTRLCDLGHITVSLKEDDGYAHDDDDEHACYDSWKANKAGFLAGVPYF